MSMRAPVISLRKCGMVYPIELTIGCIIAWFLGDKRLEKQRKEQYLLSSKNIINQIFVYNGDLIWTILFCGVAFTQIYVRNHNYIVLPRDARTVSSHPLKILIKQYACKLVLKNILLIITFMFIDNLFVLTGGSCVNGTRTRSAERCRADGGKWEGGFDISGHFCFLVNISMILWVEIFEFQSYVEKEELASMVNKWFKGILWLTRGVLITWMMVLMVTSIYYHTVLEKIIGCGMGYICPFVMYWVIPRHTKMNKWLYY